MTKRAQSLIGLGIAAGIMALWLAIHLYGIFAFEIGEGALLLAAALVLAQAWLSTGLFITAHDAMHGALAPAWPRLQERAGIAALLVYAGLDYRMMAPKHFEHHKHVGGAGDPDFHEGDPVRFWPWLTRFFRTYYTHTQIFRITAVALIYLLLGANLLNIVLFWAVPALLALVQLFYFGTYLPHRHVGGAFADRHRARSTALPDWLSLATCFHFGGYHHEHHLYPGEPWWRLPSRGAESRSQAEALGAAKRRETSASVSPNS